MIWHHLKIAVRIMLRQRFYSLLNIFGLSVGLACFIIFFLSWRYERSFDGYHNNADRIHRVEMEWTEFGIGQRTTRTFPAFAEEVVREFPQIEHATRLRPFRKSVVMAGDRIFNESRLSVADPSIFHVLTLPLVTGDPEKVLAGRASVVISESAARKYFGPDNPMGNILRIALTWGVNRTREFDFEITGIMADSPPNSSYRFDFLLPVEIMNSFLDDPEYSTTWKSMPDFTTLVLLARGASPADIENGIREMTVSRSGRDSIVKMFLTPLTEVHRSDPNLSKYLAIFGTIALVVLLLAAVNTINLSTAQAVRRIKEVGVKKIAGADRRRLVQQFMTESFLASAVSFVLALIIVEFSLPGFAAATGREIRVDALGGPLLWSGLLSIVGLVALASGFYPAVFLSRIRPVELFSKSRTERTSRSLIRKSLVFAQFSALGTLLIGSMVVSKQLSFIRNARLGMDKDDIMILRMDDVRFQMNDSFGVFKNEVERLPVVKRISYMFTTPPNLDTEIQIAREDSPDAQRMVWSLQSVDDGYLETFSIRLIEGRNLSSVPHNGEVSEVLVNETAARMLGLKSPVGVRLRAYIHGDRFNSLEIVGVVENFHGRSLHHPINPLILEKTTWGTLACLKIEGDSVERAVTDIAAVWKRLFPYQPIDHYFLEDEFRTAYRSEERLNLVARSFSVMAVIIACLGLLGLVAFSTDQRRKEVGIRRVLGSSSARLIALFAGDFFKPILLANLVAWPVAYLLAQGWLRGFVYRTEVPLWLFPVSGVLTAVIAFATIQFHVLRSVRRNPVESLRYE